MVNKVRPVFLFCLAIAVIVGFLAASFGWLGLVKPVLAAQEQYRQCPDDQACEIGEFLFDDDYTPIADADCTFTARDPAGALYLDEEPMTPNADGWYSYDVTTTSQTLGLYRSQICCLSAGETVCVDKSFEIVSATAGSGGLTQEEVAGAVWDAQTADHTTTGSFGEDLQNLSSLSAADIWAYPQRSLTSFGTLIADTWSYSSRSLNSFSSLVTSIWTNTERTTTNEITDEQFDSLTDEILTNRLYLERLVNAPIIETFIEEGVEPPENLQVKIQETKKVARLLATDIGGLKTQLASLNKEWASTNYQLALNELTSANRVLGVSTQDPSDSENINSRIAWLAEKWSSSIIANLTLQTDSALSNITGVNREIKTYGKTFISKQYLEIAEDHAQKLQDLLGEEGDAYTSNTLFGYIADIERVSEILVKQSLELDEIFLRWDQYSNSEKDLKLSRIKETFLSVNKIPGAEVLLKEKIGDKYHRENLALSIQGLVEFNLTYLTNAADQLAQTTWLEFGSVIFKSLATNPSSSLAQEITVKYYLPEEIQTEDIIKMDEGLEVVFDSEKNTLYVTGVYLLQPEETKTIIVETADVWVIPEEEIASLRNQTQVLFESLRNTSYFAQGSILKSDIDANLDKVGILTKTKQTPEMKIKAHREAMLELNSANTKLESLKTLVSSAGSVGTLFGFVGGVQAIAVWGLIIILIAGFVFLAIYLRMISNQKFGKPGKLANQPAKTTEEKTAGPQPELTVFQLIKEIIGTKFGKNKKSQLLIGGLVLIVLSLSLFVLILLSDKTADSELVSPVLSTNRISDTWTAQAPAEAELQTENATESGLILGAKDNQDDGGQAELDLGTKVLMRATIPEGFKAINVRTDPTPDAELTGRLYVSQNVYMLQERDGWVLIEANYVDEEKPIVGWILQSLVEKIE
jgi:hypothetical protein